MTMIIQHENFVHPKSFGMRVSKNSSAEFRFFSEEFIKGGYLKVFNKLFYVKNSQRDTITFSDCHDFIYSSNSNVSPYFFYNFNNDEKKYKLSFPPLRSKSSVKFPIKEIIDSFLDYKKRTK